MVKSCENKKIMISPSILNVPLEKVSEKLKKVRNDIEYVHIDVMDGKFVTNCTDGVGMFEAAKAVSDRPLDVHLMVAEPENEIEKYKGAEFITIHLEAFEGKNREEKFLKVAEKIRNLDAKVGISIKPNTKVSELTNLLKEVDLILIMTVEPGYGGQKLIAEALEKVTELRNLGFEKLVEVDGGINIENASYVRNYDIDIIVAGTAVFGAENENEAIRKIKGI